MSLERKRKTKKKRRAWTRMNDRSEECGQRGFQNTKEIKQHTNQRHTQPGDVTTDK